MNRPGDPSVVDLWKQARGDGGEYRRLLREHGMLVDGPAEPLPCGWTPGQRQLEVGDRIRFVGDGVDQELVVTSQPDVDTDGSLVFTAADPVLHAQTERLRDVLDLPPEHRAARERTDEERAALDPFDPFDPFDCGGVLPSGLAWYRNNTGHAIPLDSAKRLPDGVTQLSDGDQGDGAGIESGRG